MLYNYTARCCTIQHRAVYTPMLRHIHLEENTRFLQQFSDFCVRGSSGHPAPDPTGIQTAFPMQNAYFPDQPYLKSLLWRKFDVKSESKRVLNNNTLIYISLKSLFSPFDIFSDEPISIGCASILTLI